MGNLTEKQVATLITYLDAIDNCTSGIWTDVNKYMADAGIDNPEEDLEEAREALNNL